jgi:hypothetical protein
MLFVHSSVVNYNDDFESFPYSLTFYSELGWVICLANGMVGIMTYSLEYF